MLKLNQPKLIKILLIKHYKFIMRFQLILNMQSPNFKLNINKL